MKVLEEYSVGKYPVTIVVGGRGPRGEPVTMRHPRGEVVEHVVELAKLCIEHAEAITTEMNGGSDEDPGEILTNQKRRTSMHCLRPCSRDRPVGVCMVLADDRPFVVRRQVRKTSTLSSAPRICSAIVDPFRGTSSATDTT